MAVAAIASLLLPASAFAAKKKLPTKLTWTLVDGNTKTQKLKYDKNGNVVDFGTKRGIVNYQYKSNRLNKIKYVGSDTASISFKYNKKGNVKSSTYKMADGTKYTSKYSYKIWLWILQKQIFLFL